MLSDQIAVMNQGRVEQLGTPLEIFRKPRTRFVADFMGVTNFLTARCAGGGLQLGGVTLPGTAAPGLVGSTIELAIRPEEILLDSAATDGLPVVVEQAVYHGTTTSYGLRLPDGQVLTAREPNEGGSGHAALRFSVGDAVTARWRPDAVHLLQS